jgi:hypothetical protein
MLEIGIDMTKLNLSASILAAALFTSSVAAHAQDQATSQGDTVTSTITGSNAEIPSLNITSPAAGASVGSDFVVSATVVGSGVAQVEVFLDGVSKGVKTAGPYNFSITGAAAGDHTVNLIASGPKLNLQTAVNVVVGGPANPPANPPADPNNGGGTGGGDDDGSLEGERNDNSGVEGGCNAGALGSSGGGLMMVMATMLGLRRRKQA